MRQLWPLGIGFGIWAVAFIALYAAQALGCLNAWPEAVHRAVLLAIWVATLAMLGLALLRQWRQPPHHQPAIRRAGLWCTIAAAAASLATYLPVTFVSLCL